MSKPEKNKARHPRHPGKGESFVRMIVPTSGYLESRQSENRSRAYFGVAQKRFPSANPQLKNAQRRYCP
ncbi:hypothetical protein ACQ0MK_18420 [Thalassospira lucentensis]|uniref:hypothetical protein n=1 Tax=Thalassospira lucentensis TaxID=168935 RepID=UPI003D2EB144